MYVNSSPLFLQTSLQVPLTSIPVFTRQPGVAPAATATVPVSLCAQWASQNTLDFGITDMAPTLPSWAFISRPPPGAGVSSLPFDQAPPCVEQAGALQRPQLPPDHLLLQSTALSKLPTFPLGQESSFSQNLGAYKSSDSAPFSSTPLPFWPTSP